MTRFNFLQLVSLLFAVTRTLAWQSQQPLPAHPSTTSHPRWSEFQFASNGVCTTPARFVDTHDPTKQFTLRNVPGQGDCMFQAVALASFASVGLGANDALLRAITKELRALTASVLEQREGNLIIEGKRLAAAAGLLQSAAREEGLSTAAYLQSLRTEGVHGGLYGGGPELTVLSNLLRRPISIYELAATDDDDDDHPSDTNTTTASTDDNHEKAQQQPDYEEYCSIVCQGTFGGELFRDPLATVPDSAVRALGNTLLPGAYSWHLHILVIPTSPTVKHACVLLPQRPAQDNNGDEDGDSGEGQ